MLKKININLIILILFIYGCGFKVIDKSQLANLKIVNIESSGDKKTIFLIKNNLKNRFSASNVGRSISLNINVDKKRVIKEKNIKNQITKYEINLATKVEIKIQNPKIKENFEINFNGSFNVAKNHSTTINNQNNLEKNLTEKTSEEIIKKIILIINDI